MNSGLFKSNKANLPALSGDLLVADFQTAFVNIATVGTAKFAAQQSEKNAVQTIATAGAANNIYVTPRDIPVGSQDNLAKASLDAHMKKVQAEQIESFSIGQIDRMEIDDRKKYQGKKVQVIVTDFAFQPIESSWFNDKTGEQNNSIVKSKSIKGIVEDIDFENNLLVLKPTLASRVLLPSRKFFLVFVVSPVTLAPAVRISLL